jgi:hypothetical protein
MERCGRTVRSDNEGRIDTNSLTRLKYSRMAERSNTFKRSEGENRGTLAYAVQLDSNKLPMSQSIIYPKDRW